MNYRKRLVLTILQICIVSMSLWAQASDNSPYSRFGLGDITNPNLNSVALMGGIGSSYISNIELNAVNPASYSFLDYTVFDVGIYSKYARLSDEKYASDIWSGNLQNISLAFPLRNINNEIFDRVNKPDKWGMAFSLKPYSNVNYNIQTAEFKENIGNLVRTFNGNGGTYTFKGGTSYRYKDFAAGLNIGYLFGNISNEQYIDVSDDQYELRETILNNYNVRGFVWDAGVIYRLQLNKTQVANDKSIRRKVLSIGLRGTSNTSFKTNSLYSHIGTNPLLGLQDTLAYQDEIIGSGTLPAVIGFGLTYYDGIKSCIGIEFERSFWNNYTNDARPDQAIQNGYKISIGGKYLPDEKGFGNFLERTNYKWGLYYNLDPRQIDNNSLTSYGVTLGMGMPFFYQKAFSQVNLGFDLGRKGIGTPIEENYIQLNLGINFNDDQWFLKTRYK